MEGLVNYSSEDDHDEPSYHKSAERGSPFPTSLRSSGSSNGGMGDETSVRGSGIAVTPSGRNSSGYSREEDYSNRYKSSGGNRMSSSSHHSRAEGGRDARENRDFRDAKEARYARGSDHGNSNRYDYKASERNRPKDHNYKRERDHHDSRKDDERNRHATSSSSYKNRFNNSGRDERPRGERPRDERPRDERPRDERPRDERPRDERPRDERPRDERMRDDRSRYINNGGGAGGDPSYRQRHYHHHQQRSTDERSADPYPRPERLTTDRHRRSRSTSPIPPVVNAYPNKRTHLPRNEAPPFEHESIARTLPAARTFDVTEIVSGSNMNKEVKSTTLLSPNARNSEALLALPLNDSAPKRPNIIAIASSSLTAGNSEPPSVIQLPSYYNPCVINPNKYAEQVQKRKLLWGSKKAEDTAAKWGHAQFSQDSDGKVASKFMRLMGIKGSAPTPVVAAKEDPEKAPVVANPDIKSREVMFSNMEQQYEVARQATHTMRGVGLGFSSQTRPC